jgi:transmembrane sensor
MTRDEYIILYQKSLHGNCTPEELVQLQNYSDDFELIEPGAVDLEKQAHMYASLMKAIAEREKPHSFFTWKKLSAAAAVLVFMLAGLLYFTKQKTAPQVRSYAAIKPQPILPGSNKATLTLGDGRTIVLNSTVAGPIASENGTTVSKTKNDELSYHVVSSAPEKIVFNTIKIPRGGQYSLTLPDGSKVWLNAASSLRFPTRFSGSSREVELDGEAYFEVAKNKQMPFYVNTHDMKVKVLGTHFNVMAYRDEVFTKTTLLEGKVMLSSGSATAYLNPGYQGLWASNGFSVSKADIDQEMAWKNGYFIFNDENLQSVMRKVSRWYDVDVVYSLHNQSLTYTGSISRFKNIAEVLKVLSLTGTVKFNVEERRITVIN